MSTLDPLFGLHADALAIQQKRMDVLAANLANADTPHYLARDIDFSKVLAAEQGSAAGAGQDSTGGNAAALYGAGRLATDSPLQISTPTDAAALHDPALVYRVPLQPSVDGNTVDEQVEQGKFADAAMHYQASLTFISDRVKEMMTAITGQ